MWVLPIENIKYKQDVFDETGVSNLYKFMTVLKSEIYTNDFSLPKTFRAKV